MRHPSGPLLIPTFRSERLAATAITILPGTPSTLVVGAPSASAGFVGNHLKRRRNPTRATSTLTREEPSKPQIATALATWRSLMARGLG
jgi:hypothetical protein